MNNITLLIRLLIYQIEILKICSSTIIKLLRNSISRIIHEGLISIQTLHRYSSLIASIRRTKKHRKFFPATSNYGSQGFDLIELKLLYKEDVYVSRIIIPRIHLFISTHFEIISKMFIFL